MLDMKLGMVILTFETLQFNVVTQTNMHNLTQYGQWAKLSIGHAATIIKRNGSGYVTLTARAIAWQATITTGAGMFNSQDFGMSRFSPTL